MVPVVYYTKKDEAQKALPDGWILANKDIHKYFHTESLQTFLDIITNDTSPDYYEYINKTVPVNLFFDIEIYKHFHELFYEDHVGVIRHIQETISSKFSHYTPTFVVLESHTTSELPEKEIKKSYHIIVKFLDIDTNKHVYFKTVEDVKNFVASVHEFQQYIEHSKQIIDMSVYREGLFRTVFSSKSKQNRPLVVSELSDAFENNLDTFVTWCPEPLSSIEFLAVKLKKSKQKGLSQKEISDVKKFIKDNYFHNLDVIGEISVGNEGNYLQVALSEKFCNFQNRNHLSNHQYIIIDSTSAKQKCHDQDCKDMKHKELCVADYPTSIKNLAKKYFKPTKNPDFVVNEQFNEKYKDGSIVDIKYKHDTVAGKIVNNKDLKVQHFIHKEYCRGDLFYNININRDIENQINTLITCKKCGFIHSKEDCESNPVMYQLILQNFTNENRNELSIVIKDENQLQVLDNPVLNTLLYLALNQEDNKITRLIYEMYKERYLVIKNQWYCYNGTIWKELTDEVLPIELLNAVELVQENVKLLYSRHQEEQNLSHDELKLLSKITENLSKKLAKNNEDVSYITACKKYFSKPGLLFNEQTHLLAFHNGVFDLKQMKFRAGLPEDFLSIQLDYEYSKDSDPDKKRSLEKFLQEILPIKEVREFLLLNIASCLLGEENKEQEFYILTGKKGSNGKSLLCRLVEQTFGEYFSAPEPTMLTKPREKANEANEAIKDLIGKRISIMSEPNKKDRILSDNLKKFTGGDTVTCRGNHEKSRKMKMNLKHFMLCNSIPLLDDCQQAELRRLCIINFPTRFCEKPTRKNEKLIDMTMSSKLASCTSEFFNLLVQYLIKYKEFTRSGVKITKPIEVTKRLDDYVQQNKNDLDANEFVDTFIMYKEDEKMKCADLYEKFENWCITENKIKSKRKDLDDIIDKTFDIDYKKKVRFGNLVTFGWTNITFRDDLDEHP
jgi:putative DNA primase/helicase